MCQYFGYATYIIRYHKFLNELMLIPFAIMASGIKHLFIFSDIQNNYFGYLKNYFGYQNTRMYI